ncbi:MAG: hypothetical protein HQK49_07075 [Oligoflexia bacterium]|nr:hypothetical protein [Oligoflexia bacterium]
MKEFVEQDQFKSLNKSSNQPQPSKHKQCYFSEKIHGYIEGNHDENFKLFMDKHIEKCACCKKTFEEKKIIIKRISKNIARRQISDQALESIRREVKDIVEMLFKNKNTTIKSSKSSTLSTSHSLVSDKLKKIFKSIIRD